MKIKMFTLVLLANLLMSGATFAACTEPENPPIPEGESANGSDMLKAKKAVEAYMTAAEEYLECSRPSTRQHNRMVNKMEDLASKFNNSLRAYKAKA